MAGLSISKAWDETKQVIARDGRLLTTIALALFVLPGVISDVTAPAAEPGELPKFGYWTVLGALALLIALIGQLSVIRLAIGTRSTVGEAIGHGVRRAPWYFLATLIWVVPFVIPLVFLISVGMAAQLSGSAGASLGTSVATLLLIAALLFFAIRMMMSSPVASTESVGPLGIIRRSWDLTRGHWWRLFGFFLIFLIGAVVAVVSARMIADIIAKLAFGSVDPMTVGALLVALVVQVVSAGVSVLLMVMLARIYAQLAGSAEASVPSSGT